MSERYVKLFALPKNLYTCGSPVVFVAGALLKDNQTGKVLAQLKLQNIGVKSIKAVKVSVRPLDTVGNAIGTAIEYQYLDLNPYRLWCGECVLMAADHGWDMAEALRAQGIPAAVIGKVEKGIARKMTGVSGTGYLERPQPDEIYKIKG